MNPEERKRRRAVALAQHPNTEAGKVVFQFREFGQPEPHIPNGDCFLVNGRAYFTCWTPKITRKYAVGIEKAGLEQTNQQP